MDKTQPPAAVTRYHPALVILHWLLAFLIIEDLWIGTSRLVEVPNDLPLKLQAVRFHSTGGILILTLMLVRLFIRLRARRPAAAPTGNQILDGAAWVSHRLLYAGVLGMALCGLGMGLQAHVVPDILFTGEGQLPGTFWAYSLRYGHYFFSKLLIVLIALHACGALYHILIRRDGLWRRIWFGKRTHAAGAPLPAKLHEKAAETQL
jgi:cytochrome b561